MKRKLTLNEEISRMKRLMEFSVSEHSHDVLAEEKMVENYLISEQTKFVDVPEDRYNEKVRLSEQTNNSAAMDYTKKVFNQDSENRNKLQDAQKLGSCVFIKSPKIERETITLPPIRAQFYNNMVSLNKGLMPETPISSIQKQINVMTEQIDKSDLQDVTITIEGTATSAKALDQVDPRLVKLKPTITKLDHPGGVSYGGQNPNNDYLAQQRGNSTMVLFKQIYPNAKYVVKSKIIEGGFSDDEKRYINVLVDGIKKTKDIQIVNDIYLDWTVSYKEFTGTTVGQRSRFISSTPRPGFKSTISIKYGQKSVPNFNGGVFYTSLDGISNLSQEAQGQILSDPKRSTVKTSPYLVRGPGTIMESHFIKFLQSCGYLTREQAYSLFGDYKSKSTMLNINNNVFKKLAEKGSGNINDFMAAVGGLGQQTITPEYTYSAKLYNIVLTPPVVTDIP
jgi:hypothetical protein